MVWHYKWMDGQTDRQTGSITISPLFLRKGGGGGGGVGINIISLLCAEFAHSMISANIKFLSLTLSSRSLWRVGKHSYCPFDIIRKDVFALFFILNENILFSLTIPYQKPFVFFVSVFCFQILTLKLKLRPKIGLTYAISIVKWFFGIFLRK